MTCLLRLCLAGDVVVQVPFLKDRTDLVALIDEFAGRFYDELDYNMECQNGIRMVESMAGIPQVPTTTEGDDEEEEEEQDRWPRAGEL